MLKYTLFASAEEFASHFWALPRVKQKNAEALKMHGYLRKATARGRKVCVQAWLCCSGKVVSKVGGPPTARGLDRFLRRNGEQLTPAAEDTAARAGGPDGWP
jgi:hypothetical protein